MTSSEQFSLSGKIALVTGGANGIGRAIAAGYIESGARVWIADIDVDNGTGAAADIGARFVQTDLARSEEIQTLVKQISAEESHLDILVNNAGVEHVMPLEKLDMAKLDQMWQINVRAPIELTHELLPLLKTSSGAAVINLTSIHDTMPYPNNGGYSLTKAALAMFTKATAVELAPFGIRVNNLAPGAIETEINREVIEDIGRERFREWIPLEGIGTTDDVVGPAVFLASDAARYITGVTLYADGAYLQNLVRYRP